MSELIPELHDVLKITTLPHSIYKWDQDTYNRLKPHFPQTLTWKGVRQHHKGEDFREFPTDPDTFYLCVADDIASSASRAGVTGALQKQLKKLWRREGIDSNKLAHIDEIEQLFQFLCTDPSWNEFLKNSEYRQVLEARPEDEHQGRNVVSLYTHCKLTGQFYRILRNRPGFSITSQDLQGKTREQVASLIAKKETEEWKLTVARCRFRFFVQPFRVRDLNVFLDLKALANEIASKYPDNVMLQTADEVLLVLESEGILDDIAKMAADKGFWLELGAGRRPLAELGKYLNLKLPLTGSKYGIELAEKVFPICDLCQAAEASKSWPEDYVLGSVKLCPECQRLLSQGSLSALGDELCDADRAQLEDILAEPLREDLCALCFSRRAQGTRLRKLAAWTEQPGAKVAWVRLKLDIAQLVSTLRKLHPLKAEVTFSIICEFQRDYTEFLARFNGAVRNAFGDEDVEQVMDGFWCVRLDGFSQVLSLLSIFKDALDEFFPAFFDVPDERSPIRLSVVCGAAKFPFFKAWQVLESAEDDVLISIEDRRKLRAPLRVLDSLVGVEGLGLRQSALYKLSRIEETSKRLAELVFQDREDKDADTYSLLGSKLRSLDFASIFTLARLMGD